MLQRVAAYEYARQAAEMPFPGGVRSGPMCDPSLPSPMAQCKPIVTPECEQMR